jgi:hypothetical protein
MSVRFLNPSKVSDELVNGMEQYQLLLVSKFPSAQIVVHEDWSPGTGHVSDSQHYLGRAVDFHATGVPLVDAWLIAERIPSFKGIGVYPDWNSPGLHCDVRNNTTYRARWWRDGDLYKDITTAVVANFSKRFATESV